MFDIKWIRDNDAAFDRAMARRGLEPQAARLIALDDRRREHIASLQQAQERRNAASKDIGKAKASGDEERARALIEEVAKLKSALHEGEEAERELTAELTRALSELPNMPHDDVPEGLDESANVELRRFGTPTEFAFEAKEHFDVAAGAEGMAFETAAAMSGSRFVLLKGQIARLERALGQFMMDLQTGEHGYTEVSPPLLVRDEALYGTSQLPKFSEDLFRTTDDRWLIPTAEVPLTNMVAGASLDETALPIRVTALTPCFRSEAGSAGRDVRGMLRQHQFWKCELVSITTPDASLGELERMVGCAETVLQRLELPYRVMTLSAGDMGFAARKTYDIEVWLPGQNAYREISSCSVCGDFQARRMNARYRSEGEKGLKFVHTLNGSGIAVGRALIAVLENYQCEDGGVIVPDVLRPYMGGLEKIGGA
ncbi:serine--tRNA ligase [Stappia taiwanensis]|uniref:Serine--tRNA ligase n=1 Tax=Stappia taiwanensis TaxID=992267 RepID=A0A838Y2P3_9HYPH|nr:serine--tRNA ligase [Stappia taiwanensis]MBA4613263.1 serine--tRNA ligase [Stappia taiwanensis]GGE80675.1 serine--tRNA ligase [Stappia taiwanensis]